MKKLLLLFVLMSSSGLSAQLTYVPDDQFENYLETHSANGNPVSIGDVNSMGDGVMNDTIPTHKINTLTYLNVSSRNIADLTGIEDFVALQNLDCSLNQLSTLNLSQNTALTDLNCRYNQLSTLDLSQNTALVNLNCNHNQLTTLNVSQNTALVNLLCNFNQLTALDVSQNAALNQLFCNYNQLTDLDVSHNPALSTLICNNNQLTALNTDDGFSLLVLHCEHNHLTALNTDHNENLISLYCFSNQITTLDLSHNTSLTGLYCIYNQLDSLNLQNGNNVNLVYLNATHNPNLRCVYVNEPGYMNNHWPNAIDHTATYVMNQTQCAAFVDVETDIRDYFRIYSNPVQDMLRLHAIRSSRMQITDFSGKILLQRDLQEGENAIPVDRLPAGIYFLCLISGGQHFVTRLIKN